MATPSVPAPTAIASAVKPLENAPSAPRRDLRRGIIRSGSPCAAGGNCCTRFCGSSAPAVRPSVPAETHTLIARTDDPSLRTVFKVKYVAEGVAYLEGGRAQGLAEGMKLEIEDNELASQTRRQCQRR